MKSREISETCVDCPLREEVDARFARSSSVVRWAVGIALMVIITYVGYLHSTIAAYAQTTETAIEKLTDAIHSHTNDRTMHPTAIERQLIEDEEKTWREFVTLRLNSIERQLERIPKRQQQ